MKIIVLLLFGVFAVQVAFAETTDSTTQAQNAESTRNLTRDSTDSNTESNAPDSTDSTKDSTQTRQSNLVKLIKGIKAIRYEGLMRLSTLMANEIAGIKVGDDMDLEKINAAILAFHKQDYFDDIYASFEGGILTFHFVEKPSIGNVEIKGYGSESETEEITKLINLKKGDTYDIYKARFAKDVIIGALEEKGLYGSVVEITSEKFEDSVNLVFTINKGENIIIRKAFYEGATLDKDDLEALSANRERHSWLGWLPWWPDGELKIKELEYDNLRIQDVYMRQGYLDAVISPPLLSADFDNYNATLIYKVSEGARYKVSSVEIQVNDDINGEFPIEDLVELTSIEIGEYFNIETIRRDIDAIKSHIMDAGYAYARISPDLDKNEESQEVRVIFSVDMGSKVSINDVIITGNTISADRIVRREMVIAPGDIYSITDIRKSENALRRSGFFDNVKISEMRTSEDSMNLLVEVQEGRTGEIMFGLGYGNYDKLMINASLRERNLFGTGMSVQFYVNWSRYTQMYNIGLTNPRILDSEYSASINVYKSYFDNYTSSSDGYVENTLGFNASVGRNLTDALSISLSYELAHTKLSDFSSYYAYYYRLYFPESGSLKSALTPGIYFDNTDDYYFPKNGAILQASAEFAGLGGDARFIKLYGKAGLYYHLQNLIDFDLILRYKAQAGAAFGNLMTSTNKGLPITSTFYMGGIGTVRGYDSYSLTPRGELGLRIGGKYIFANSVEISYGILSAINMRVSAFFDYGVISNEGFGKVLSKSSLNTQCNSGSSCDNIARMSWGFALEWVSPIGPLVFVFPFAINPRDGDDTSTFEFTMGTRF